MEAVKQRPGLGTMAEEVEEDVSLQRKRFRQNINTMETYEDGIPVQPLHPAQSFDDSEDIGSSSESSQSESLNFLISDTVLDKTVKIEIESSDIRNVALKHFHEKIQPVSFIDEHVPMDSFSSGSGKQVSFTNEIRETGKAEIREEVEKEVGDLILESVYEIPVSHGFYCPKCDLCITKVIIRERELEIRKRELDLREKELEKRVAAERPSVLTDMLRCTECFNFLIPIGNWFVPKPEEKDPTEQDIADSIDDQDPLKSGGSSSQLAGGGTSELPISDFEPKIRDRNYDQIQSDSNIEDPFSDEKGDILVSSTLTEIPILTPALAPIEVIIDPGKIPDDPVKGIEEIPAPKGPDGTTDTRDRPVTAVLEPIRESTRWQILKSIVYGGLAESITSLGIVTSAASSDTKTVNIVVLALANLIGGLFVLGHNLRDLKNDKFRRSRGETEEQVDRYGHALGERQHIVLHFSIVILSFLVFGLIPPLVYGLSFRVSDNQDFKLAAVAATSLVCISLLALGKAHLQKPSKWQKYFTVWVYYIGIGIGVSGLSYLAGLLIGKLLDKFGWFKASSGAALVLPGTGFSEPGFGSY